jgi:hypothetical protein
MNVKFWVEGEQCDSIAKLALKIMSRYGKLDFGEADLTESLSK